MRQRQILTRLLSGDTVWWRLKISTCLQRDVNMRKLGLMGRATLVVAMSVFVLACGDGYQEAYDAGYDAGLAAGKLNATKAVKDPEACGPEPEASADAQPSWTSGPLFTAVCGGAGVDVGSTHIEPGESGCVRVFGDGRVERY